MIDANRFGVGNSASSSPSLLSDPFGPRTSRLLRLGLFIGNRQITKMMLWMGSGKNGYNSYKGRPVVKREANPPAPGPEPEPLAGTTLSSFRGGDFVFVNRYLIPTR